MIKCRDTFTTCYAESYTCQHVTPSSNVQRNVEHWSFHVMNTDGQDWKRMIVGCSEHVVYVSFSAFAWFSWLDVIRCCTSSMFMPPRQNRTCSRAHLLSFSSWSLPSCLGWGEGGLIKFICTSIRTHTHTGDTSRHAAVRFLAHPHQRHQISSTYTLSDLLLHWKTSSILRRTCTFMWIFLDGAPCYPRMAKSCAMYHFSVISVKLHSIGNMETNLNSHLCWTLPSSGKMTKSRRRHAAPGKAQAFA